MDNPISSGYIVSHKVVLGKRETGIIRSEELGVRSEELPNDATSIVGEGLAPPETSVKMTL